MKESVSIAISFVKWFLREKFPENKFFENETIHMHFPEGASKKDGPSAGIAIASALMSMALNKPYNIKYAMTGEISLNGKVLKIGGLKEKSLAAKREGIKKIICPKDNEGDYKEMKSFITEDLEFHFVKDYKEVYDLLFE